MIVTLVPNLLLRSQLNSVLSGMNVESKNVQNSADMIAAIKGGTDIRVILDLNAAGVDTIELLKEIKRDFSSVQVIGFFSHVDKAIEQQAKAAAIDLLYPRSKFFGALPGIISQNPQK